MERAWLRIGVVGTGLIMIYDDSLHVSLYS